MIGLNLVSNSLSSFKYLFSKPQFAHILSFVLGLIVAEKDQKNVQNIAQIVGTKNQSSLNRFLTTSKWNVMNFLCSFIALLVPHRQGGILILDDTLIEKSSMLTEGVGKLRDHVKGRYGYYHVMVSTFYLGFNRRIPMFIDAYLRKKVADSLNSNFRSKIDIGIALLQKCLKFVTPKAIVFDSWYLSKKLVRALPKTVRWVSRLKLCWNVFFHGKELSAKSLFRLVRKERFRRVEIRFGRSKYRWVTSIWINVKTLGRVKLVLLKKRWDSKSGIILVSNADWSCMEIIALYKKRWAIEVFYRDAKQHLGLGDYQVTKLNAIIRHWHLVAIAYGLLKNRRLIQGCNGVECKQTIGEVCRNMKSEYRIDKIVRESFDVYEKVKDVEMVVSIMKSRVSNL